MNLAASRAAPTLEKCPTGIAGFDTITGGGLPRGRTTLLSGRPGTGKTIFGLEFLLHGIAAHDEAGIFVSFEEGQEELTTNVAALGFDLAAPLESGRLRILHIDLEPEAAAESGNWNLDGLFLRIGHALDTARARRIVLDGSENLFSAFDNPQRLRTEFRRLLRWLKERGLTSLVTTEAGKDALSRHGIEEYIADCAIALDNRLGGETANRHLRIVKYRGSAHGGNEYPFIIGADGIVVMPVTAAGLDYAASTERHSTGIEELDHMLGGGVYRGSSLLISGTSGTGKSSIAAHALDAACARGEPCLYFAFEESPAQIVRNMASIGLDLVRWQDSGLLRFHAVRPTAGGLEAHLARLVDLVDRFKPRVVALDPVSAFAHRAAPETIKSLLVRAVDLFKSRGITSLFTTLTPGGNAEETTDIDISSLVDVWLLLRNLESNGERTRGIYVCKARGTSHSNRVREFLITDNGLRIVDIVRDEHGAVLTGSARRDRFSVPHAPS